MSDAGTGDANSRQSLRLHSALAQSGIHWPAIPSAKASRLMALLHQFEQSERCSPAALIGMQRLQADALLSHARSTVPFYAERLARFGDDLLPGSRRWLELPLLTRGELLTLAAALRSSGVPGSHGRIFATRTSGSTGQPVEVLRTELLQLLWGAITLREHYWHARDASLTLAVIRATGPDAPPPDGRRMMSWGAPFDHLWQTGSAAILNMTTDVRVQVDWLRQVQPSYLLTYPTNLNALLDCIESGAVPPLREVLCVGETVSEQLREKCAAHLGIPLVASYSSQELGYIALQCPDCNQYHVQSGSVFVEVLDDEGMPCSPGQSGRVVVTDLHNFAMPLIRYEIGDYAEVGGPCAGGCSLPTLRRILGRRRNMVVFPDGTRYWPLVGFSRFNDVARIRQYQCVQNTRDSIEVRIVVDEELSAGQLEHLTEIVTGALGYPFQLTFRQFSQSLPQTAGGKFEEFISIAQ